MVDGTWIRAASAGAVLVGLLAMGSPASGAPGDLEGGFGTAGQVAPVAGYPEDVVEAGGNLYTVSETGTGDLTSNVNVRAFTSTGAPLTSFSSDGALDIAVSGSVGTASIAVDGSGRIVVAAGVLGGPSGGGQRIWRFEADGDADLTFDTDGVQALPNQGGFSAVNGLGFQADGDLLVGINDTFIFGGLSQFPQVVRLTGAGAVAQTIDVLEDYTERGSQAITQVDGSGRPSVLLPDDGKLTIHRYTASLVVDNAYSGDGVLAIARPGGSGDNDNWGGALHVAADGTALVAGTVGSYTQSGAMPPVVVEQATLLAKVTVTGTLDPTFSTDGIVAVARPTGAISPIAVGPTASGGAALAAWRTIENSNETTTLAWQLNASGAAETGFSGDGRIERAPFTLAGTTSASGVRFYLYESNAASTAGQLVAVQLVAPTVPPAVAPPKPVIATGTSLGVSFSSPTSNGGSALTKYEVLVYQGSSGTPIDTIELVTAGATGNFQVSATGLSPKTLYRFKVRWTNGVGTGPASAYSAYGLTPFPSVEKFVRQQFTDFLSKAPTAAELSSLKGRVEAGTITPAAAVAEVSAKPEWATLDPLTRIYYAYFGRAPDSSGLKYWLGKRRTGTKVSTISNQFVTSNEFKTKYGSLSNRAFVQLVYQNVLGRAGDTAGVNSWTAKLDAKTKTRGDVMVQFSESGEHVRRRAGEVNTVSVIFGMLVRAPYTSEFTTWVPQVKATKVPLIESVLGGAPYDNRVPGT